MEAGDGNGFGSDSEHDSDLDGAFQAFPILNSLSPPLASFPFPSFKIDHEDGEGAQQPQQGQGNAPIGIGALENFLGAIQRQFHVFRHESSESDSDNGSDDDESESDDDEGGQGLFDIPRGERDRAGGKYDHILFGKSGDDGLFKHVRLGNVAQVRQILESYAGLDSPFPVSEWINLRDNKKLKRDTLLIAAVRKGHTDVAKLLLAYGADAKASTHRYSILHHAVKKSYVDLVELLLMPTEDGGAGMNVAETAVANWQPLHYAGFDERRDDAVVLCLLNHGADPNAIVNDGRSSLHIMTGAKRLQRLIEHGGDVDLADKAGNTPVFVHAQRGDLECVKVLVEAGALVNIVNQHGETPFTVADMHNMWETALYLWEHGGAPSVIRKLDGLDDLRWFRRRLKPSLRQPTKNFTPRVKAGIAAVNGVVYVCGGVGFKDLSHDTENWGNWDRRTEALDDLWAFDLNDDSDASILPRTYSVKAHAGNALNRRRASAILHIAPDDLTVTYTGPTSSPASVIALHAIHRSDGFGYFEMTVLHGGESNIIAMGLVPDDYRLHDFPGWRKGSYGYHGDDGSSFHNCGSGSMFGPRYTAGDIAGVGINFKSGEVFYTLNGEFLGVAYKLPQEDLYYPYISMNSHGESVRANFGQRPFAFNFDAPILAGERLWENTGGFGESNMFAFENRLVIVPRSQPISFYDLERRVLTGSELRLPHLDSHPFLVGSRLFVLYKKIDPLVDFSGGSDQAIERVDKSTVEVIYADLKTDGALAWNTEKVLSGFVPHMGQSFAQAGTKIFAWGSPRNADRSTVHIFDTETLEWSERRMNGFPPLLRVHSNTFTTMGDEIISFGGYTESKKMSNNVDVFDTRTLTWYKPHVSGTVPRARMDHAAVVTKSASGSMLMIAGGWNGRGHIDDIDFLELHRKDTASGFGLLLNASVFADVHFSFPDSSLVPAHAAIVSSRSEKLREMITSAQSSSPVTVPINAESDLFLCLLRYLYTDNLDMAAIGSRVGPFLALVLEYAPQHRSRITQSLLLTRVVSPSSFSVDLAFALNNPLFSDITLIVEGKRFPAHKCIVCTRAGYFKALLSGGLKEASLGEVELKEIDERSFVPVLRHIYTRALDAEEIEEILLDVFIAASRFDVVDLKAHLEAIIQHNLSSENVVSLLLLSEQENAPKLRRSCVRYIQGHRSDVEGDPQWPEVVHMIPK